MIFIMTGLKRVGTVFAWNMKDLASVSISGLRTLKRMIIIKLNVIGFLTFGF